MPVSWEKDISIHLWQSFHCLEEANSPGAGATGPFECGTASTPIVPLSGKKVSKCCLKALQCFRSAAEPSARLCNAQVDGGGSCLRSWSQGSYGARNTTAIQSIILDIAYQCSH